MGSIHEKSHDTAPLTTLYKTSNTSCDTVPLHIVKTKEKEKET